MLNARGALRRYTRFVRFLPSREVLRRTEEYGAPEQMRRVADAVVACILLTITGPLLLVVALAIKLESPGPILVKKTCIGRGRRFQMLKFRTLPHDPEAMLPSWNRHPTALGEILRFTRIEALPQAHQRSAR
jgi:lipopolysaccharide/colanic/teichoic acid biosynthesis glycosyltransferase